MKKAGIIGGIGSETTIEYYRAIISEFRKRTGNTGYPSILINSIDMDRMMELIGTSQLSRLTDFLLAEIDKLNRAGADFALLASNSAHIVIHELQEHAPLPLISIIEAVLDAVKRLRLDKVGLLGTRVTMRGGFYNSVFSAAGVTVEAPDPDDQALLQEIITTELVPGTIQPETREKVSHLIERFKHRQQIQGLILGATEISPLLRDSADLLIPFFDSTRLHVDRIVDQIIT